MEMAMDLYTAVINADKTKATPANLWEYCNILSHANYGDEHLDEKFGARVKDIPIHTWMCTDALVGLYTIIMDNEVIGWHWQSARKSDCVYRFLSRQHAEQLKNFIEECTIPEDTIDNLVASKEELEKTIPAHWNLDTSST
jgi:hypothetical protein